MPSTNKTQRGLTQYEGTDKISFIQDYNADMRIIDGNLPIISSTEPLDQPIGGIWFDISEGEWEDDEEPSSGSEGSLIIANATISDTEPEGDVGIWFHVQSTSD